MQGGPKLYILNKIKDTSYLALLLIGQRNNILSLQTKSKNTKNSSNNPMFHTRVRAINSSSQSRCYLVNSRFITR